MENKFQHAKIYKIVDNSSDLIYIGSTCESLNKRLRGHEMNYKSFKSGKSRFTTSFKILDNNNYKIELIKLYPCINKQELCIEEGKIIKELKTNGLNIVNKCISGQTKKESMTQYYEKNKNTIKEYRKQKNICVCGGRYTQSNKLIHEKSKKHQNYLIKKTIINNHGIINITININNIEDLENLELDFLNAIK